MLFIQVIWLQGRRLTLTQLGQSCAGETKYWFDSDENWTWRHTWRNRSAWRGIRQRQPSGFEIQRLWPHCLIMINSICKVQLPLNAEPTTSEKAPSQSKVTKMWIVERKKKAKRGCLQSPLCRKREEEEEEEHYTWLAPTQPQTNRFRNCTWAIVFSEQQN